MTSEPDDRHSILLVDDDERFRTTLARAFERRGWDVTQAENAAVALELGRADSPEYAVVDLKMPDGSGIQVVRGLLELDPATRVVLLTGFGSIATAVDAMRAGAVHYLTKPANVDDIIAAFDPHGSAAAAPLVVPSLDRVEWEHIQRVLAQCDGNVTRAAELLGIHRRSLQRKLGRNPARR